MVYSVLYLLIALVIVAMIAAFIIRSAWAFSLPGLMLLVLILYLLLAT